MADTNALLLLAIVSYVFVGMSPLKWKFLGS